MKFKSIVASLIAVPLLSVGVYGSKGYSKSMDLCKGDSNWFNNDYNVSKEINGNSNCAFQQFAWEWFVESVRPVDGANAQFETWMPSNEIFVPNGQEPSPWANKTVRSKDLGKNNTGHRVNVSSIDQAGSMQPLISQNGEYVFYEVIVNKPAYDFITECNLYKSNCVSSLKWGNKDLKTKIPNNLAFPNNSVELKNAWMILDKTVPQNLYFETIGTVLNPSTKKEETHRLGLIGMHLIVNTNEHPEFIWATFEHRNNAPDCDNKDAKPPLGGNWNLFNPDCNGDHCKVNTFFPNKPAQVCRENPFGNPTNQDGLDDKTKKMIVENGKNIESINNSMIEKIKNNKNIDTVWANYEMTGNIWTKNGVLPPLPKYQRGSLSSENMTMETFTQNGVAGITPRYNCFSCHTSDFGQSSAAVAHIFDEGKFKGGCTDNKLPQICIDKYAK